MRDYTFSNGVQIINCTPHIIRFDDNGQIVEVEPSGVLLNAKAVETVVATSPVTLVKTVFEGDVDGFTQIAKLKEQLPTALLVGSVISAQAYAGLVVGMTPAVGFERVAPDQKRMSISKFSIF